jgi:uncharacterized membrane protein
LKRFNDWIGDLLANKVLSTMLCFYVVSLAILITLFFDRPTTIQGWLLFWVTVFFQGVALPLLGYVSKKSGEKQEKLLQETHDAVMAEMKILRAELILARKERRAMNELIKYLHEKLDGENNGF